MAEHPEDKKQRLEGEKYGRDHAEEFCAEHAADFVRMIATWRDDKAQEVFEYLREQFWACLWKPTAGASETPAPPAPKEEETHG